MWSSTFWTLKLKLKGLKYLSQTFLEEIHFTSAIPTITYAIAAWGTWGHGSCMEAKAFESSANINVQAARVIKRIPRNVKDSENGTH